MYASTLRITALAACVSLLVGCDDSAGPADPEIVTRPVPTL